MSEKTLYELRRPHVLHRAGHEDLTQGMRISASDWSAFLGYLDATLDTFQVPQREREEVVAFIQSTRPDIVEV
jgi:hypothetical protein